MLIGSPLRYRIFRTQDGGSNWQELPSSSIQRCDNQCSHNNIVVVHPTNPNTVFVGQVPLFRSTDGGMTWRDISGPGSDPIASGADIHGDNMALVFDPIEPSVMYLADDGGVTKGITNDVGAVTWRPLSQGLVIGQFGTIGIAPLNSNVIAGGLWHNNNALTQNGGGLWQKFGCVPPFTRLSVTLASLCL
jgi:photosystem II stability/assembly factor-like uncharacterized protein